MIPRHSSHPEVPGLMPSSGFTQLALGAGGGQVQLLGLSDGTPYLSGVQLGTGAWTVSNTSLADKSPAQTYTTLVTGAAPNRDLEVLGLDPSGLLSLACWRDVLGNWHPGASFENVDSQPYSALVTGAGNDGSLQIVALGTNGLPYLARRIEPNVGWKTGFPLPSADSNARYSALVTTPGPNNSLLVMGLNTEGLPLLASWQDSAGNWSGGRYLDIEQGPRFSAIATGNSRSHSVEVVGLTNGLPYLACRLDSQLGWQGGHTLPNVGPQQYTALVTGQGADNSLLVVGLGTDGLPYLPCYLDKAGNWNAGQPLHFRPPRQYKALFTSRGASQSLLVLGLGKNDNQPYLVCFQDKAGNWHSGLPLGRQATWMTLGPTKFDPDDVWPDYAVVFQVSSRRSRATTVTVSTSSLFADEQSSFVASPGDLVFKELSSTFGGTAEIKADIVDATGTSAREAPHDDSSEDDLEAGKPGRLRPQDTMQGTINVVRTM